MENNEAAWLVAELAWTKRRLAALAEIEINLTEMKCLAELARDHSLTKLEILKINRRINYLQVVIADLNKRTMYSNENLGE